MTIELFHFIITVYVFIIGLVIGSYLNVVIYRLPLHISTAKGRSYCPSCEHQLHTLDLFPVLSYLVLGGRCRYCKAKISLRYPLIELLTGFLFCLVYQQFGLTILSISYGLITALLIVISMIDYDTLEIHDRMHVFLVMASLPILWQSTHTIWFHVAGAMAISIPLLILMILTKGGIGGGDVKLMAACGLFLGPINILVSMMLGSIIGSIIAVFLLITKQKSRKDMIPFGPFLAIGIFISMLYGNQLVAWYLNFL